MPRNTVVRYLTFPQPGWQQRGREGGRKGEGRGRWHFNSTHTDFTQLDHCALERHHFLSSLPHIQSILLSQALWEGFPIFFSQHGLHLRNLSCGHPSSEASWLAHPLPRFLTDHYHLKPCTDHPTRIPDVTKWANIPATTRWIIPPSLAPILIVSVAPTVIAYLKKKLITGMYLI